MNRSSVTISTSKPYPPLKCDFCHHLRLDFQSADQFILHLRSEHCAKEGGSFVCRYGEHNVCKKLPFEGVSDSDYKEHVLKYHMVDAENSKQRWPRSSVLPKSSALICGTSQNLAAVLNDPRKSRREVACFFTRYWSDSFVEKSTFPPPAGLTSVDVKDFQDYLVHIGKRKRRNTVDKPKFVDSSPHHGKTSTRDIVPEMFFSAKFSLQDPQCFEALFLTANVEIVPHVRDHSNVEFRLEERLKPCKILEEKLSLYLDSIEIQIARHVAAQSGSFFRAMTSHDDLQQSLGQITANVRRMRLSLKCLDDKFTTKCLTVINLKAKRSNRDAALKKLELISTVKQTQSMVQTLLHLGDYLGAIELISTTQIVLKTELINILCFRHLYAQLNELKGCINKMLLEEFLRLLRREFDIATFLDDSNSSADCYVDTLDEASFTTLIIATCQTKDYKFMHLLSEEIYTCIKKLVRECIKRGVDPADDNCDTESIATKPDTTASSLAEQMRKLDFYQWHKMFGSLVDSLKLFLLKTKLLKDLLKKILRATLDDKEAVETLENRMESTFSSTGPRLSDLYANIREFLCQSCTYAQERLVRVLIARCKDDFIEKLATDQFLALNDNLEQFYTFCNELIVENNADENNGTTGGAANQLMILPLRCYLHGLTLKFLHKFHEDKRDKLGNILDLEHWKVARVPILFQAIVDTFGQTKRFRDVSLTDCADKPPKSFLVVSGEEYAVTGVSLIVIQIIAQYGQLVDHLPSYAPELLNMLVELLKIFNSRTCQLILGAGALHLVGLKSIGARNLALASRCLQLVLYFINHLHDYFGRYISTNRQSFLRHVNQLSEDYQKHVDEIAEKLFTIMKEQMLFCLKKWKCVHPVPSQCFKKYTEQCQRFYDNVKDVMPSSQLQKLLLRLHSAFKFAFKERMEELNVLTHSPSYDIACSEFSHYLSSIKKITCCSAIDDTMQDVMTLSAA